MRLLATIMCGGPGRELTVGRAVASCVDWVDGVLLVNTDNFSAVSRASELVPFEKLYVSTHQYEKWDCATGRNFCLSEACRLGFDVVLILDSDEWINTNGVDLRAIIESMSNVDAFVMFDESRHYPKTRFIRVPAAGSYCGRVHEDYVGGRIKCIIPRATFGEVRKSPGELASAADSIERLCREWIADEPECARPYYFLGHTLAFRGHFFSAVEPFERYIELIEPTEEKAWSTYMVATCYGNTRRPRQAIDICVEGLKLCPYFPEFHGYAAIQYILLNMPTEALAHADACIALGEASDTARVMPQRLGFQAPEFHWEIGWQVREVALRALADATQNPALASLAQEAQDKAGRARLARLGDNNDEPKPAACRGTVGARQLQ
jgi:hypothetical protein